MRAQAWCPEEAGYVGVRRDHLASILRGQALSVVLAVSASALDSFFLAMVELGWVDSLFGQEARLDLGFRSVVALSGEEPQK